MFFFKKLQGKSDGGRGRDQTGGMARSRKKNLLQKSEDG